MMARTDTNHDGVIDFDEFKDMMTATMGKKSHAKEVEKAFGLFDRDKSGSITVENLRSVATELGESVTDDELKEMIRIASSDGTSVTREEFERLMHS
mmetsp:Transcript_18342/g.51751  ORF Transcript_18342/g.51751 Transcript_18342/m.51751 type:complete len:97 (-) Transcript_18342:144-434(-)